MNKKLIISVLSLIFTLAAFAQPKFDPAAIDKSLVRVVVTINEKESTVMTGFVWKTPNQIVTSLHGMSKNGTIKVLYLKNAWRKARIKKVLQNADLVLLEVLPGEPAVPAGVVPITSINTGPIRFGSEVYAFGFNSGAPASSSRMLKKGHVDPEVLASLIPKKDKDALAKIGFPALDLHILYLEGSLLPGYSGSPVFDSDGKLIGIGDGGLEKGASNVSWIIPSKYLAELEASTVTSLPPTFEMLAQLFSAKVTIDASADDLETVEKQLFKPALTAYKSVKSNDFEFFLTKSRSLTEILETSDDPDNLLKFSEEMSNDLSVELNYDQMRFDVYEDIVNGVVLTIPEGLQLVYDNTDDFFFVKYPENSLSSLTFTGIKDDFSSTEFAELLDYVSESVNSTIAYGYGLSGLTIDQEYSYWLDYGDQQKIAWVSSAGNEPFYGNDGVTYVIMVYQTILMSNEKTFMAVGTFAVPAELVVAASVSGLDCVRQFAGTEECEFFNTLFKTFSATHLTTFAY